MRDIKFLIEADANFRNTLNKSRKRLDTSTKSGRALDEFLTNLYNTYGDVDSRVGHTRIHGQHGLDVANEFKKLFPSNDELGWKLLAKLGIPEDRIKAAEQLNGKINELRVRALHSLRTIRQMAQQDQGWDWDIYGIAGHVVNLEKAVDSALNNRTHTNIAEICEQVKSDIYYNPSNVNNILEKNRSEVYSDTKVIKEFKKLFGLNPFEYAEEIASAKVRVEEGILDYGAQQLAKAGDAVLSKFGGGGVKYAAQARQDKRKTVEKLFKDWVKLGAKGKFQPSPQSLKNYMLAQGINVDATNALNREFKARFQNNILPKNLLRNYFTRGTELDIQHQLKAQATKGIPAKPKAAPKPAAKEKQTAASPQEKVKQIADQIKDLPDDQIKNLFQTLMTKG